MSTATLLRRTFISLLALFLSTALVTGCGRKTDADEENDDSKSEQKKGMEEDGEDDEAAKEAKAEKEMVLRIAQNTKTFRLAKVKKAVQYIAEKFPEGEVAFLIYENSFNDIDSEDRFVLDETQKRLTEKGILCGKVITIEHQKDEDEAGGKSWRDPEETFARELNMALADVQDRVNIVVNFVGLPNSVKGFNSIRFISRKPSSAGKNNMLLMNDAGLAFVTASSIEAGRVSAIIDYTSLEGANFSILNDLAPKDLDKAFSLAYFIVRSETLDRFNKMENNTYFINR